MKICEKRGKRGRERKAFTARLTLKRYIKLCEIAGTRSLSEALEELIRREEKEKADLVIPTSHGEKNSDTLNSSFK